MAKEEKTYDCGCGSNRWQKAGGGGGGAVYGLGFIGALIYFIHTASSFWDGVLGVLQAIVWPAYFVYYILEFLKI